MDITAERCEQVISDLQRISVQDAHRCLGCGREHNWQPPRLRHNPRRSRPYTVTVSSVSCKADDDNAE